MPYQEKRIYSGDLLEEKPNREFECECKKSIYRTLETVNDIHTLKIINQFILGMVEEAQ